MLLLLKKKVYEKVSASKLGDEQGTVCCTMLCLYSFVVTIPLLCYRIHEDFNDNGCDLRGRESGMSDSEC